LPFLLLTSVGVCDAEFGSGSGGGGGSSTAEAVRSGEVYEISSGADVEGIDVELEDESSGNSYGDTTDSSGAFKITGGYYGTGLVTLTDSEGEQLAVFSLNIFHGSAHTHHVLVCERLSCPHLNFTTRRTQCQLYYAGLEFLNYLLLYFRSAYPLPDMLVREHRLYICPG
jgi:hypothetical protein